ncbi:MAG TPA: hypothetical protein VM431_12855 [Phycisphaerae bacterium]|nr:hypothetical protein [Phycisphaerae bacterium]
MRNAWVVMAMAATLAAAGCNRAAKTGGETPAAEAATAEATAAETWPGKLHRLPPWGWGTPGLAVNLPPEYEMRLRSGEDNIVFMFERPPELAPPESATLCVYVGHQPRDVKTEAITQPGRVAGKDVTWYGGTWQNEKGRTVYHVETYVDNLFRGWNVWRWDAHSLVVHVFIWGTDQPEVEALMQAAASLRLDRK